MPTLRVVPQHGLPATPELLCCARSPALRGAVEVPERVRTARRRRTRGCATPTTLSAGAPTDPIGINIGLTYRRPLLAPVRQFLLL